MIRNLKVLGLALMATFAFAGLSASAASAGFFHSEVEHTIVDAEGSGDQVFVTPAGSTTCKKVTGDATLSAKTVTEVTGTDITYTECTTKTIFGSIAVTVNFGECDYKFTTDYAEFPVHIECPTGKVITIEGPGCKITVGKQTVTDVTYTSLNAGSARDILMHAAVHSIHGEATGAFCSKQGTFTTGSYTGTVTFKGTDTNKNQVGIWYTGV